MRVDYLGLEAFVAIADYGSFQRAAEALSLSQAALSHRLKKIEDDLGSTLLNRSSREVSLTGLGQTLLPEARRLLKALSDTYASAQAGARREAQRVSFACLPSVANSILPGIIARIARDRPEIGFNIVDIPVVGIPDAVRSGSVEFGVTIVSAELSDLRVRPLADEEYHLLMRADHPLAGKSHVTLDDIEGMPLALLASHSKSRQLLDVAFGGARDRVRWNFEVQSAHLAIRLVVEGAAATILPQSTISQAPAGLVSVPFRGVRLHRTIGIVSRRGTPLSNNAADVLARIETAIIRDFAAGIQLKAPRPTGPAG